MLEDEEGEGAGFAVAAEGDTTDGEGDVGVGSDDELVARDWRRLQKLMEAEPDDGSAKTHPWFESRSLAPGAVLPTATEAGPNPLEAVFGINLEAPRPSPRGMKRKNFYPGQEYDLKDLNPHNHVEDPRAYAKRKFLQLMRSRTQKDPFKEGKLRMPIHRDVPTLSRFVSERGRISPRRRTGVSAKNQRVVKKMIKRARAFGLLPYTSRLERPQKN